MEGAKWEGVKQAFADPNNGLLAKTASTAFFGLTVFSDPANAADACAPGRVIEPFTSALGENVGRIQAALNGIQPKGGTPTAPTLQVVRAEPSFAASGSEGRYAMLLTDGLPNCNGREFAQSCPTQSCASSDPLTVPDPCSDPSTYDVCLDDQNLVAQITALRAAGVETFVIGFGAGAATGDAIRVLDAAAVAGGQTRSPTSPRFYQANDAAQLQEVLERIAQRLLSCEIAVEPVPNAGSIITVLLVDSLSGTETSLESIADWTCANSDCSRVQLTDAACQRVKSGAPDQFSYKVQWFDPQGPD
jgi:hypothetical protein